MATTSHGKAFQLTIGGSSFEEGLSDLSLSMDVDTAEVTTSSSTAKEFVTGDYSGSWSGSGVFESTNTTGNDELFFATIGAASATWSMLTQTGAVGATNPSYAQSVISTNYTISCSVSDANRASYAGQGTGAITRAEA